MAFIASTGPCWDHRYYYKQIQSLLVKKVSIDYWVNNDSCDSLPGLEIINMDETMRSKSRKFGGLNLFRKLRKKQYDGIQICNVELLPLGIALSLFSKSKIFYDCREDHVSAIRHHKPWIPIPIRYIISYFVELMDFFANALFDGIILSDDKIYHMRKMPDEKKYLFYNMALKKHFPNFSNIRDRKFDFAVLGSMSIRTGVLNVVEALVKIKKDYDLVYKLKLIGDPKFDNELKTKISPLLEELGQENYEITGRYNYGQLKSMLNNVKVGIIPLLNLEKFRNNMATKQFEYMANAMPIIASNLPPQRVFLTDKHALFYTPGNVEALVVSMRDLMTNEDKLLEISNFNRAQFEDKFNAETQMVGYSNFILSKLYHE